MEQSNQANSGMKGRIFKAVASAIGLFLGASLALPAQAQPSASLGASVTSSGPADGLCSDDTLASVCGYPVSATASAPPLENNGKIVREGWEFCPGEPHNMLRRVGEETCDEASNRDFRIGCSVVYSNAVRSMQGTCQLDCGETEGSMPNSEGVCECPAGQSRTSGGGGWRCANTLVADECDAVYENLSPEDNRCVNKVGRCYSILGEHAAGRNRGTPLREVASNCQCEEGYTIQEDAPGQFSCQSAAPIACFGGTVQDGACVCPEGYSFNVYRCDPDPVTECPAGQEIVNGACLTACRPDQIRVGITNSCVCPDGTQPFGHTVGNPRCEIPVTCANGFFLSDDTNTCECQGHYVVVDGVCGPPRPPEPPLNLCDVMTCDGPGLTGTAESREEVLAGDSSEMADAVAELGIASAYTSSAGPVTDIILKPARLIAIPVVFVVGAAIFINLYGDYEFNPIFDYRGENTDIHWEAGTRFDFHSDNFASYLHVIQDKDEITFHSGTDYAFNSFIASYDAIEAKDYMNYRVQFSSPWTYRSWEISPNLSSKFDYRRDENQWDSSARGGLDLELKF